MFQPLPHAKGNPIPGLVKVIERNNKRNVSACSTSLHPGHVHRQRKELTFSKYLPASVLQYRTSSASAAAARNHVRAASTACGHWVADSASRASPSAAATAAFSSGTITPARARRAATITCLRHGNGCPVFQTPDNARVLCRGEQDELLARLIWSLVPVAVTGLSFVLNKMRCRFARDVADTSRLEQGNVSAEQGELSLPPHPARSTYEACGSARQSLHHGSRCPSLVTTRPRHGFVPPMSGAAAGQPWVSSAAARHA